MISSTTGDTSDKSQFQATVSAEYLRRKNAIDRRLSEFREWGKASVFPELCFCLLTPQSKARNADKAIKALEREGLLSEGSEENIKKILRGLVRFHNNKAKYIVEARKKFSKECVCAKDSHEAREWLVENIKGLGYKEASHFLRNIGLGEDLAILDRHILKNLKKYGVIRDLPRSLSRKKYLEIEEKMKAFSKKVRIPMDALDLLFWSFETGEIFK